MNSRQIFIALLILVSLPARAQVKAYQEPLTLPTYGIREPEIMPDWRVHRYPYTMMDRLTNVRGTRTYNALYVENEYVKALVLPELGGRLHGAEDKTNGYGFLYDQKVIKGEIYIIIKVAYLDLEPKTPLFHRSNIPFFQYSNLPPFHYSIIPAQESCFEL